MLVAVCGSFVFLGIFFFLVARREGSPVQHVAECGGSVQADGEHVQGEYGWEHNRCADPPHTREKKKNEKSPNMTPSRTEANSCRVTRGDFNQVS